MKYMHFKASCSYAALAAIMENNGVDTEDYNIALEIKLPWLFSKEDGSYLSGPMLQGAKWFNLWLRSRGFRMVEETVSREKLCGYLRAHRPAMLGIRTPGGKHAVVFTGYDGTFRFLNPTHENSGERTELSLSEEDLLASADPETTVGTVAPAEAEPQALTPYLYDSISIIRENCTAIEAFAAEAHGPEAWLSAMDGLFRPLLLDGITMLELAGETALAEAFTVLQRQLLEYLRGDREKPLAETLPLDKLRELTEQYAGLIREQIGQTALFYHGSVIGGLDTVLANSRSHADGSRVAYFTTDRVYALVCCRSRRENFVTMGPRDGIQHYFERFPDQLKVLYDGKEGFLYSPASSADLKNTNGHTWESSVDVPGVLHEHIPNVYTEILSEEAAGNVVIHRYAEIDPAEQKLHANYIRDHLNDPICAEYRDFLYRHFSPLWD